MLSYPRQHQNSPEPIGLRRIYAGLVDIAILLFSLGLLGCLGFNGTLEHMTSWLKLGDRSTDVLLNAISVSPILIWTVDSAIHRATIGMRTFRLVLKKQDRSSMSFGSSCIRMIVGAVLSPLNVFIVVIQAMGGDIPILADWLCETSCVDVRQ
jgi:hypothetical protein